MGTSLVIFLSGSLYYATFIDDAKRNIYICFLRQKIYVFENFKKWRRLVENEIDKLLKCLKFDNGGKYCRKYIIVPLMVFIGIKWFQGIHKKMEWLSS
jgi:hypothetical protein